MIISDLEHEQKIKKLTTVTERLIKASEKNSMSTLHDHPWEVELTEPVYLKIKERISIYGTPYWEKTTEEERRKLAFEEMITWWSAFIHLESLVVEAYQAELNNGCFNKYPEIRQYMRHFIKEELIHTIVFQKGIDYFGAKIYPMPDFLGSFYKDHANGKDPLMSVFLTMMIEWIADEYQRLDTNGDEIHPMARNLVQAHWKEEMRHIKWGQNMIKHLIHTDEEFKINVQQLTPIYLRQQVDQGVTNIDCFDRVQMADPAFEDKEALLEAVLYSEHRQKLNAELVAPLLNYYINSGVYTVEYHDTWVSQGFGEQINEILARKIKKISSK
ncbi:MAG: hypothetical protein ACJAZQ_001855 [Cognaticolwellia sp.]|jgi:hypothetical protein